MAARYHSIVLLRLRPTDREAPRDNAADTDAKSTKNTDVGTGRRRSLYGYAKAMGGGSGPYAYYGLHVTTKTRRFAKEA